MECYYANASEVEIKIADLSFLCVFGNHINGGWCAIVNWKVAVELTTYVNDIGFNYMNIRNALKDSPLAWKLPGSAKAVDDIAWELSETISKLVRELEKTDDKWPREHLKDMVRRYIDTARSKLSQANNEMREYYDKHGMSKNDFKIYSRDPEWHIINNKIKKASQHLETLQCQYDRLVP